MKRIWLHLGILLLYTFLTCLLLYPLPLQLDSGLLDAQEGDPLMQIWVVRWTIHKLNWLSPSHYFDANIFYPYSNTFAYHDHMFGLGLLGLPIYAATQNPIITYNLLFMLSFLLSAYGMYLLARELTQNDYAAFLAGVMFGFLPYRFAHLDHLNLLSVQWLPLCLFFLTRALFADAGATGRMSFFRKRSSIFLFWGCFLLQTLTSFNYLFLLTFTVGMYIVITLGAQAIFYRHILIRKQSILLFLCVGCLVGLLLLPFVIPYLNVNKEMGFERTLQEAQTLSARIQDYMVAPETNMLYGRFTSALKSSTSPFPREQMLFPGTLPILLAVVGIVGTSIFSRWSPWSRRRKGRVFSGWLGTGKREATGKIFRVTYLALFAFGFILSLGPSVSLFGRTISLPYVWLYRFVPGFKSMRVPARFGLFAVFSLAVLAAFGVLRLFPLLQEPRKRPGRRLKAAIITGIMGGVLVLEFFSFPKPLTSYPGTQDRIPEVYQWLARQSEDFAFIELPVRSARDNFEYTYYSTFHWERMVNGRSAFIPRGITQIFGEMLGFPSDRAIDLLKSLGVRYVILHTEKLSGGVPRIFPEDIRLVKRFGPDLLFEVPLKTRLEHLSQLALDYQIPSMLRPNDSATLGVFVSSQMSEPFSPLPHERVFFEIIWKANSLVVHQERKAISLPVLFYEGERFTLPLSLITPQQPGDYDVIFATAEEFLKPQTFTTRVTLAPDMLDSRNPGKLQAEFLRVEIPDIWERGKPLPVRVLVKNSGDTLWKARVADRAHPVGEVHLGVMAWYDASSETPLPNQERLQMSRGFLVYDVAPGKEMLITANIATPDQSGDYLVRLDMVSELIQWFSDQGSDPLTKKVILE